MDYRFAIRCWQDQAGDENAKANIFVDGVQVATEVEITATSADSPQLITWESLGLTAPAADTSFDIKVVLTNEYYVDASTDRNIHIDGIGYISKSVEFPGTYRISSAAIDGEVITNTASTVTDFTDYTNYTISIVPTAVTGDNIASDWWSGRGDNTFFTIPVYGGDTGVTISVPVQEFSEYRG
jgi:hypothetical protein